MYMCGMHCTIMGGSGLSAELVQSASGAPGARTCVGVRVTGVRRYTDAALLRPCGIVLSAFALEGDRSSRVWRMRQVLVDIGELKLQKRRAVIR